MLDPATYRDLARPPLVASLSNSWHGHMPFARWLLLNWQPSVFVELGVWTGDSYLAFCDAVRRHNRSTRCFGIDTWEGDAHAGVLPAETYRKLAAYHNPRFGGFSTLRRERFETAVATFGDGLIDLLHIDGLHTYEAVRRDFETWQPKMSTSGLVLFHDACVHEGDFGVHRLWDELKNRHPSFLFQHSRGLGVLSVGAKPPEAIVWLTGLEGDTRREAHDTFAWLGATCAAHALEPQSDQPDYEEDVGGEDPVALDERARERLHRLVGAQAQVRNMQRTLSWRVTRPLRALRGG
ncbi:MAG TPA: class I SAM-dependent methyltransferase [Fimbriimonadaceae bacterium]|nr:class I SAM-dependent methyltransferase [Fimbriimonadaceae bacterium]